MRTEQWNYGTQIPKKLSNQFWQLKESEISVLDQSEECILYAFNLS